MSTDVLEFLEKPGQLKLPDNPTIALVGNPNCGKTTLFNYLTKLNQKIANYPGATVDYKCGKMFTQHGKPFCVVDFPGAYSLNSYSLDSEILINNLISQDTAKLKIDALICVIDSSHLERSLYFLTQVLELGIPSIIALNMSDKAERLGLQINAEKLSQVFGIKVFKIQAHNPKKLLEFKLAISKSENFKVSNWRLDFPDNEVLQAYQSELKNTQHFPENSIHALTLLNLVKKPEFRDISKKIITHRYQKIFEIVNQCVIKNSGIIKASISDILDQFLLHPVFGWVSLLGVLGTFFYIIFALAEYPMELIDWCFSSLADKVQNILPQGNLTNLITEGIIGGVGSVLAFLPQIGILTFFLGILEKSGYMARLIFLLDKPMSKVGLSGQAFIPFLTSHACAIPGVLSARVIKSPQERLATILVLPFTSCSARIPIYLLMIAMIVPAGPYANLYKAGFLILAYFSGAIAAGMFALLFRKTFLKGKSGSSITEMPKYHIPNIKNLIREVFDRCKKFVKDAGTLILGMSIILWVGLNYPKSSEDLTPNDQLSNSYVGRLGHFVEPVFNPLGYDWKTNIGILSSFTAREVFVSTLSIVHNIESGEENNESLLENLKNTAENEEKTHTPLKCLSLLTFYIFAMQCMSTNVIVYKETKSLKYMFFQFFFMTGFAYLAAFTVYQVGRFLGYV